MANTAPGERIWQDHRAVCRLERLVSWRTLISSTKRGPGCGNPALFHLLTHQRNRGVVCQRITNGKRFWKPKSTSAYPMARCSPSHCVRLSRPDGLVRGRVALTWEAINVLCVPHLLWRGDTTYLSHQAHHVEDNPLFFDLATSEMVDENP